MMPDRINRYYFCFDAYLDVAHPITKTDAAKEEITLAHIGPRLLSKEIGYDLKDGDVLVAVKQGDLELLLKQLVNQKTEE